MVLLHDDAEKYGRYQTYLNGDAGAVRETAGSAVSMI